MVSSWKQYCINESTEWGRREKRGRAETGRSEHLPTWIVMGQRHCLAVCSIQKIKVKIDNPCFLKITFNTALEMLTYLTLNRKLGKLSKKSDRQHQWV